MWYHDIIASRLYIERNERAVLANRSLVFEDDVQGVDETGDETQDGQGDVDEEVDAAAALEEDTQGREDDGEDDLADVAGGVLVLLFHFVASIMSRGCARAGPIDVFAPKGLMRLKRRDRWR